MRRALGPLVAILALAGALAAGEVGRRRAQAARAEAAGVPDAIKYAPSAKVLRALSLGERGLAADFLMLRTIAYFANARAREQRYPWLAGLLGTIVDLDPKWRDAYLYGAYFLSGEAGAGDEQARKDKGRARVLLERGMVELPRDPELILRAARIYLSPPAADAKEAAKFFRRAQDIPGDHQRWIPDVLRGIHSEDEQWHVLERMFRREIDRLETASSSADRAMRRHLRRQYIECAAMARREEIKIALRRFIAARGTPPRHIEDLVAARTIARVPAEPFGTEWDLDIDLEAKKAEVTSRGLRILRYNRFVNYVKKLLAHEGPGSFRAAHAGRPPRDLAEFVRHFREEYEKTEKLPAGFRTHFPELTLPPHPLTGGYDYRYNSTRGELLLEDEFTLERLFGEKP